MWGEHCRRCGLRALLRLSRNSPGLFLALPLPRRELSSSEPSGTSEVAATSACGSTANDVAVRGRQIRLVRIVFFAQLADLADVALAYLP